MRVSSPLGRNFPHHPYRILEGEVKRLSPLHRNHRDYVPVEGLDGPHVPILDPATAGDVPVEHLQFVQEPLKLSPSTFAVTVAQELPSQKGHNLIRPSQSGPEQTLLQNFKQQLILGEGFDPPPFSALGVLPPWMSPVQARSVHILIFRTLNHRFIRKFR